MAENHKVCKCKNVMYSDIADALQSHSKLEDAVSVFDDIQKQTQCSTGCGGCHDKVMDIIANILSGAADQ
ncbi:MAG: (2Fe-2S)-binding protein [Oscillospiraceae bacterium]|nr:(2Fe-2S)-binding protein [Oscillospiraceae bacterium]